LKFLDIKKGIGKTIPFSPELTTPSHTAKASPIPNGCFLLIPFVLKRYPFGTKYFAFLGINTKI
jgi:hypothetical protein